MQVATLHALCHHPAPPSVSSRNVVIYPLINANPVPRSQAGYMGCLRKEYSKFTCVAKGALLSSESDRFLPS